MFNCKGCGEEFKVNERPPVFDGDGQAYHYKCLKSKESRNVPQGQANDRERSAYVQLSDVRELVKFCDWILNSKISLCDKRCLMQDIDTEFGNIKSNYCERESCPDLVLKLLLDSVRAHF